VDAQEAVVAASALLTVVVQVVAVVVNVAVERGRGKRDGSKPDCLREKRLSFTQPFFYDYRLVATLNIGLFSKLPLSISFSSDLFFSKNALN
jgi:hypothetical protein